MSELVEFIRGCLDADVEFARASSPRWWSEDELLCAYEALAEDSHRMADARFAARQSPARVLAEVNAKRDILASVERALPMGTNGLGPSVLLALAQPYAGEPGWRDEWGTQ